MKYDYRMAACYCKGQPMGMEEGLRPWLAAQPLHTLDIVCPSSKHPCLCSSILADLADLWALTGGLSPPRQVHLHLFTESNSEIRSEKAGKCSSP